MNLESDTTALTRGTAKPGSGTIQHYAMGEAIQGDHDPQGEGVGVRTDMKVYSEYV